MDVRRAIRMIGMLGTIWLGLITTVLVYSGSKGIITHYFLVAILLSVTWGVLIVGASGYTIFKGEWDLLKKGLYPGRIIIYWLMLVVGFLSLWKWFSFSPHVFKDLQYLVSAIIFIGIAGCRLIAYYWLRK